MTRVLVLGGGSGGLVAANKVKRLLGKEVEVTLVDRNTHHEFMPAYPWVAFGMREPEAIRRPLANLEKRGIRYLQATVEALDPFDATGLPPPLRSVDPGIYRLRRT